MKKILTVLLSVMLLVSCLTVNVFAAEGVSFKVEAEKSEVVAGDTVKYSVYLENADQLDGGVWAYEFKLVLPAGLELVSASAEAAEDLGFNLPAFNAETLKCTSGMGAIGVGYSGAKGAVLSFECKVAEDAEGELEISLAETVIGGSNGRVAHEAEGAVVAVAIPHECAEPTEEIEPTFVWSEDYERCVAEFKCACGEPMSKACQVNHEYDEEAGITKHTATVEIGGRIYTDVVEVKDAEAPETADGMMLGLYVTMLLMAAAAVVVLKKKAA